MHPIKDKENKLLQGQALTKFVLYDKPRKKVVEWVSDHDIYKGYRFRKRHITINEEGKNIVHAPYIPLKESTSHEFSLTFPEWKDLVVGYWNIVVDEMTEGNQFELPKGLGHIQMVKRQVKKVKQNKLYRNNHTQGYSPFVVWNRFKAGTFLHKMWYMFNISRKKQWSRVSKQLMKNPSLIYSYPEGVGSANRRLK